MAAMLSAGAAMVGQDCDETKPEFQSVEAAAVEQVVNLAEGDESKGLTEIITVGGIQIPEDAEWIDDRSLPDLPIVVETESGQTIDTNTALVALPEPR